jgi:uncharacterized protein (TIGR03437 family)
VKPFAEHTIRHGSRWLGALLLCAALPGSLAAQALVTTQVTTTSPDVSFQVDGQWFAGTTAFTWPAGSKHQLSINSWQWGLNTLLNTRYVFQHWNSSAGLLGSSSNQVTITADAGIAWYRADLAVEYAIWLRFFRCDDPPCTSPGTVWVNQIAYLQDADVWAEAGSTITLDVAPNAGYVFTGWTQGGTAALTSLVLNAPTTLYPSFALARPVQLRTSPEGLLLLADRALVTTPVTLEWGWSTSHTVSVVSPQSDANGRPWVFHSWSDGGPLSHSYQVQPGVQPVSLVAEFLPRVAAALLSAPLGLTLTVDGQDAATPRNLSWASGETHLVTAPLRQTDAAGTPWVFREWSNGGASVQSITVSDSQIDTGIRLTASYDPRSRILLSSTPSGLALMVDGAPCLTPCEVERSVGSAVQLSAPSSIPTGDGVRLDFSAWEGTRGPTLTAQAGIMRITAHYGTSYRLALSTQPANGGSWRVAPASADGFFPGGTVVALGLDAANGMSFHGWGMDLSGAMNPTSVLMDRPHAVAALLDSLPAPPTPPTVLNSAGETPLAAVAPGSIASLFGSGLAAAIESSGGGALRQTLGGVTLRCQGRVLGLLYAAPPQINFQVPGDLAPGEYTLDLLRDSGPALKIAFTVARDAPGLFLAAHADGRPITPDAPAGRGETVILYGTGFGPYLAPPMDGFPVPASPPFNLIDEVSVSFQGQTVSPDFAGAVPGSVGLVMVRMQIPQEVDLALATQVLVKVGGIESNTIQLPPGR